MKIKMIIAAIAGLILGLGLSAFSLTEDEKDAIKNEAAKGLTNPAHKNPELVWRYLTQKKLIKHKAVAYTYTTWLTPVNEAVAAEAGIEPADAADPVTVAQKLVDWVNAKPLEEKPDAMTKAVQFLALKYNIKPPKPVVSETIYEAVWGQEPAKDIGLDPATLTIEEVKAAVEGE